MAFPWLDRTSASSSGSAQRAKAHAAELADRAATLYRLGFPQAEATRRLTARVAWEYEPASRQGGPHRRPEALSDAAIAKLVADTYARRPAGNW